jgi:hypothetical protein
MWERVSLEINMWHFPPFAFSKVCSEINYLTPNMAEQLNWLVTGCSSGLGEAMVKAILAKVGSNSRKITLSVKPNLNLGGQSNCHCSCKPRD